MGVRLNGFLMRSMTLGSPAKPRMKGNSWWCLPAGFTRLCPRNSPSIVSSACKLPPTRDPYISRAVNTSSHLTLTITIHQTPYNRNFHLSHAPTLISPHTRHVTISLLLLNTHRPPSGKLRNLCISRKVTICFTLHIYRRT